ncbi:hypothetical protein L209DRAFT_19332 [Thermothelomyces heterothallicus CBS 203.75]
MKRPGSCPISSVFPSGKILECTGYSTVTAKQGKQQVGTSWGLVSVVFHQQAYQFSMEEPPSRTRRILGPGLGSPPARTMQFQGGQMRKRDRRLPRVPASVESIVIKLTIAARGSGALRFCGAGRRAPCPACPHPVFGGCGCPISGDIGRAPRDHTLARLEIDL